MSKKTRKERVGLSWEEEAEILGESVVAGCLIVLAAMSMIMAFWLSLKLIEWLSSQL